MPELPDVTIYIETLERLIAGKRLARVKLLNPFILRTAVPPIGAPKARPSPASGASASASCWSWKDRSTWCST